MSHLYLLQLMIGNIHFLRRRAQVSLLLLRISKLPLRLFQSAFVKLVISDTADLTATAVVIILRTGDRYDLLRIEGWTGEIEAHTFWAVENCRCCVGTLVELKGFVTHFDILLGDG